MRTLLVEGWRTGPHSYALVNQHQLLQWLNDRTLRVFHRDVPFFYPHWGGLDSGLPPAAKAKLAALEPPPQGAVADVTYRISYPFRIHPGGGRVFVHSTNELDRSLAREAVGADGRPGSTQPDSVEIVTPSSWSRRAFLKAGFSPERIHVIPHGIDPALAVPLPAHERRRFRQALRLREEDFAWLHIGAMTWNKGIGPLLAAFAMHRRSYPHSVLVLKGGDALYGNILKTCLEEAARLRAPARDLTLGEAIRYIPENLSTDQIACLYHSCDAYVAPYRAEGFNLPVLEAMAAGVPVLVTRGGATDDFCLETASLKIPADPMDCELGTYLEPRIDSLVELMGRLYEEPDTRARIAARAREHALQNHSWQAVTGRLTQLLFRSLD